MDEIIAGVLGVIAIQTGRILIWLVSFGNCGAASPCLGTRGEYMVRRVRCRLSEMVGES